MKNSKIKIWNGTILGNSERSKLVDMTIGDNTRAAVSMLRLVKALQERTYRNHRVTADNFTYLNEILPGFEKQTYTDEPYIMHFPCPGSKKAVLIICGGGFVYKSCDTFSPGYQTEGDMMAKILNKAGYNAFVLWYRSNPYRFPIPIWDASEAVNYLAANNDMLNIDENSINMLGFSAGAYLTSAVINRLGEPAHIQAENVRPRTAAFLYPCFDFRVNPFLLSACFDDKDCTNEESRNKILDKYDGVLHFSSSDVPQFLCHGTNDMMAVPHCYDSYVDAVKKAGGYIEVHTIEGAGHGFGCAEGKSESVWIQKYLTFLQKYS